MSDPMQARPTPPPPPVDHGVRPRRGGSLLWVLVLLAIVAAAWYFMGRGDAPYQPPPPIGETTPMPSRSPVSTAPVEREPAPERAAPPAAAAELPARPIDPQQPAYPPAALRAGDEGTVLLRVEVGADGKPTDVQVAGRSGSRELDRAAERAVRDWTFQPATRNGKAVASTVQVPVDFRVEGQ